MKSPAIRLLMVALVLAGKAFCQSSGSTSDAVALYVKAEMARQHIPGVALLVSRNGEPVRAQGFGFSNLELQVPVKPETLFQSGSVGKQFTATALMMLVEERKIGLDDSITKYFPDAPADWKPVTVRHLLSHTGGFTDYPKNFDFRKDYGEDELLKIVEAIPRFTVTCCRPESFGRWGCRLRASSAKLTSFPIARPVIVWSRVS